MNLTMVPYYRLERDADGKLTKLDDRLFVMALRWWPAYRDEDEGWARAVSALRRLQEGDEISTKHLRLAQEYLHGAWAYYDTMPAEPYAGRNEEAKADLDALLAALTAATMTTGVQRP